LWRSCAATAAQPTAFLLAKDIQGARTQPLRIAFTCPRKLDNQLRSGWQGSKKATVEGSLVLTASALVRKKALVPGAQTAGSWGWTYEGEDGPHATIRYEADLRDTDNAWLRLHYRANGEAVDYKVQLVTTKPNYGGRRWWFICPIVRRDGGPPRRVAKLYLPSGSKYFGSREAYALTYTSCQESGK
jgi:hypothetical protein